MSYSRVLAIVLPCAALFGCGGDDDGPGKSDAAAVDASGGAVDAAGPDASPIDANIDGAVDAGLPACAELDEPAVTLDSYPATFAGTTDGAGNNLHVHDRVCTVEPAELFDLPGPDQVVELTALAPGRQYVVRVLAPGDGPYFYVITGCDVSVRGPGADHCLLFDQVSFADTEVDRFIAPADGHAWVVLDSLYTPPAPPYAYFLQIYEPECEEEGDCPEGTLLCADNRCHQCLDDFDCLEAGAPICDFEHDTACVASTASCDGDDGVENGDDGPAGATPIAAPVPGTPVTVTGAYCRVGDTVPAIEADYYRFTVPGGQPRGFALDWEDETAQMVMEIVDADDTTLGSTGFAHPGYVDASTLAAGSYYLRVTGFSEATADYTITALVPECDDSFGCATEAEPVCAAHLCAAGPATCVDDDAAEGGDDGPAGAMLLVPTAAVSAVATASICSVGGEYDVYRITLPAERRFAFDIDWTPDDFVIQATVYDPFGSVIGGAGGHPAHFITHDAAPGDYYVALSAFGGEDPTASVSYTLTASVPECGDSYDCTDAAAPVCTTDGECVAGPADCTDDDADGDDGPAAATILAPAVGGSASHEASVCGTPFVEADFYAVTVAAGDGLTGTLTADALSVGRRLELAVFDGGGARVGWSRWVEPEVVTLDNLAAGTYYLVVTDASGTGDAAALAYTIDVTRAAGGCDTDVDCATTYSTQLYRGDCQPSGACARIEGNRALASGERCDSDDDCDSGACSYGPFAAGADGSVCTIECFSSDDCATLGAGFACANAFFPSVCRPLCSTDLDCGMSQFSTVPDPELPWDYVTCDVASGACTF